MSNRPAKKSAPTQPSKPKRKPTTAVETSSDESEPEEEDDEEYIFKAIPHHQHLQEQQEWNTVVNTKKIKREERFERKKEREAEMAAAVAAEQERYRQQAATNPYANLLAPKPTPQYNAFGRKKIGPKVHKYVHSPEDEEEFHIQTNFEKVQQKKAERSSKKSQPSKPTIQIQSEQDLINTIIGILNRSPEPYLPVATAAAELAKLTKTSWQDTYKRQYGPIATFLTSHPDTFALIDGDKLFLKSRLEVFLQTTIGRPTKKKVKATDDTNNADGKKKKKNKQNGHIDGDDENEDDESQHTSSSSSSTSTCGRCCSTLFLLLLSLLLVAIICLVILSIKRVTIEEAFTRLNRLLHPYIQRIQPVIKPYIDQLAVYITEASQQIKERWVAAQSKQAS